MKTREPTDFSTALDLVAGAGVTPPPFAGRPALRQDDWYSSLTGLGSVTYDKRQAAGFCARVVDWAEAIELWRGDDLAGRIVETVPSEMLRQGYELRIGDDDIAKELQEEVSQRWAELGLDEALNQGLCYERAYGGAAILLGINDGSNDLSKPLDIDRVQSFDFMTVLEPREAIPIAWYADALGPKFGKPAVYQIMPLTPGASIDPTKVTIGSVLVHETRMIIFPGIRVTRHFVPGVTNGWGDSVLTRVTRVLRDFNLSWSSTGILVSDFAQGVYSVKDLNKLFATDNGDVIKSKMQAVELSRSTARAILIDTEEKFERQQTPVTGLPDLLDRFSTRLAAAADMPLTLLMGQSPGGLGATGESDIRFFYDRIKSMQLKKLTPILQRLAKITFRAMGTEPPDQWSLHFAPLWQATEKETAESHYLQAQTDQIYITTGVVDAPEITKSRFGGDGYSYDTQIDFDARADDEPAAPGPVDKVESPPPPVPGDPNKPGAPGKGGPPFGGPPRGGDPRKLDSIRTDFVEKRGEHWVVLSHAGDVLGTHPTKAEADAQLGAIEAAKAQR